MNNIYKYDWFTRDDNYTVSNKDIKLGWESIVGTQYSKYLYSNSIVSTLLGNNVELVCELSHINKMLGLDNQVIIDDKGLDSYTDGKTIVISPFYAKMAECFSCRAKHKSAKIPLCTPAERNDASEVCYGRVYTKYF